MKKERLVIKTSHWFSQWLDWTRENKEYLRYTRVILDQPALGRVDGTSAIIGNRGFVFLFNPNARRLRAEFRLVRPSGSEVRAGTS